MTTILSPAAQRAADAIRHFAPEPDRVVHLLASWAHRRTLTRDDVGQVLRELGVDVITDRIAVRAYDRLLAEIDGAQPERPDPDMGGIAHWRTQLAHEHHEAVPGCAQASRASAELEAIRSEIDGGAR